MPKQNCYVQKKKTSFEISNIEKQTNSFNSFKKEFMTNTLSYQIEQRKQRTCKFPISKQIQQKKISLAEIKMRPIKT